MTEKQEKRKRDTAARKAAVVLGLKYCSRCEQTKSRDSFYLNSRTIDKLTAYCQPCTSNYGKKYYELNPDKKAAHDAARQSRRTPEKDRASRERRKDKISATGKRWREANKERKARTRKDHRLKNPSRYLALRNKRRARKLHATPEWLTGEDHALMEKMYEIRERVSKCLGIEFHVDHEIPLQGKTVCGLHVPWNLQLLPAYKNISKGNRLE